MLRKANFVSFLGLVLVAMLPACIDRPVREARWEFSAASINGALVSPLAGQFEAVIAGPLRTVKSPFPTLVFSDDQTDVSVPGIRHDSMPKKEVSLEAWVSIEDCAGSGPIICFSQGNPPAGKGAVLGYDGGRFFFAVSGLPPRFERVMSQTAFQAGAWHYVVGTYDGATMRIYVDGRLEALSSAISGDIWYPPDEILRIGACYNGRRMLRMRGCLHEAAIHGAAIPSALIENRFQSKTSSTPKIKAESDEFIDALTVEMETAAEGAVIRYTLDGSEPTIAAPTYAGPLRLNATAAVCARAFLPNGLRSAVACRTFTKIEGREPDKPKSVAPGIRYDYYEVAVGDRLPDFSSIKAKEFGVTNRMDTGLAMRGQHIVFRFTGYIMIEKDGMYRLYTESDDGSRLWIGDQLVVDNDGLHGSREESGSVALKAGLHRITVAYFQAEGDMGLNVSYEGPGIPKQTIPEEVLFKDDE